MILDSDVRLTRFHHRRAIQNGELVRQRDSGNEPQPNHTVSMPVTFRRKEVNVDIDYLYIRNNGSLSSNLLLACSPSPMSSHIIVP